ncbi:GIY-YIG nuclease family protein [Polaromonas sp. JS666]|uniref:GIY-YIG nuclease family protein n=1 Tax=Polaromonas sp. (strain JS666 / ATCC BAA-500) TaxID=296591 RepID=UPI0000532536|nr:GIY-YIG nuclease family protein [Polaromonas sp. JS666]ABE43854.1 Excinuclease ABC, C subunit-like protein [Polaromonas sp. JS666]
MPKRKTAESVLSAFRNVHGQRYGYELVSYAGMWSKVKVVCSRHGVFEVTPEHHFRGVGCSKCYFDRQKLTKADFIARAEVHFGNRFGYGSIDELPAAGEKVRIKCKVHDLYFLQEPRNHSRGHVGCPKCKSLKLSGSRRSHGQLTSEKDLTNQFILDAQQVHGNAYDYSEFKYLTARTKGKILCPVHGEFFQAPSNHLRGTKCPACAKKTKASGSFKQRCRELGIDYWRALKRREAGMSDEKIFAEGYVRGDRETPTALTVYGVSYPNIELACRVLLPTANPTTIGRWIRSGMAPEEAFERIPNPGYAAGLIYLVTHVASGKRYVGLTIQTLERRWTYHLQQARAGHVRGADSLHAAIREHGSNAFTMVQIDSGTTKVDLEQKERHWINAYGTLVPAGYNISAGGVSGGSNRKPVTIDGQQFPSVEAAVIQISKSRGISLHAAKARLRFGRIDVKTPAKKGESLVKTPAYKAWSRIVHGVLNQKAKDYIPGVGLFEPWRDFQTFFKDVGQPPEPGMAFTRLDKSKGFFPENCVWLTKSESSRLNAVLAGGTVKKEIG